MIYTSEELKNKLGSFNKIKSAVKNKQYYRISYGLYSDKTPFLSELENIFARYPNTVLTLESAYAFYELSDYVPSKYVIASSQKAHKININKVKQIYLTKDLLDIGKVVITTKYGTINIYDKERLLIELFRLKSKFSYPYFKEVINSYRNLYKETNIDTNKLNKYCSYFKNGESLRRQIENIIT